MSAGVGLRVAWCVELLAAHNKGNHIPDELHGESGSCKLTMVSV